MTIWIVLFSSLEWHLIIFIILKFIETTKLLIVDWKEKKDLIYLLTFNIK